MSEANFWAIMRHNCKNIKLMRVENKCEPGMPDIHFITKQGTTGWIELKYIDKLSRRVKLRPNQPKWLTDYSKMGGCAMIIVQVGNGFFYIIDGSKARELHKGKRIPDTDCIGHTDKLETVESYIIGHSVSTYRYVAQHHFHMQ